MQRKIYYYYVNYHHTLGGKCWVGSRRVGAVVLPDVGARLPDVVSPAQQWGAGEYQCPGPAHHQETLGDLPPVKLALPWERSSNWVCVCCNCKVFLELLFWREIQECKLFIYYLELTGNLMMRNLQREREARLHMATIPAVQSQFWHPHSTTVHFVFCFVLLKCHSGQIGVIIITVLCDICVPLDLDSGNYLSNYWNYICSSQMSLWPIVLCDICVLFDLT